MTADKSIKRFFIVGVARSGTTLVQSFAGAHPDMKTFPETHFLDYNFPDEFWKKPFHSVGKENVAITKKIMKRLNAPGELLEKEWDTSSTKRFVQSFFEKLDEWTKKETKSAWLEKTPIHVRFLDKIEMGATGSTIIHVIRNPVDNIASLVRVSRRHPGNFKHFSLRKAMKRYKRDLRYSLKYAGKKNHLFIDYKTFCQQPEGFAQKCWKAGGLKIPEDVQHYKKVLENVTGNDEYWKAGNQKQVEARSGNFEGLEEREIQKLRQKEEALEVIYRKFEPHFLKLN